MKKLLENVILLLVTAILVLGIYNYVKSNEEPKEEDPIVDVLPDDEQPGENETPGTDVEPGEDEKEPEENPVQLATFRVGDKEYQFEEGMTWSQFVDSEYNVDNFYFQYPENDTVLMCGDSYICDGAPVDGGTLIVANRVYTS